MVFVVDESVPERGLIGQLKLSEYQHLSCDITMDRSACKKIMARKKDFYDILNQNGGLSKLTSCLT